MSCTRMQFSLATLLLYITCFSVLLGGQLAVRRVQIDLLVTDEPDLASSIDRAEFPPDLIVRAALQGVAILGMLRLGPLGRSGMNLNPGRWILLISGATVIIGYVAFLGQVICIWGGVLSREIAGTVGAAGGIVPMMVGTVVAMRNLFASRVWAIFFGYYTVLAGATLVFAIVSGYVYSMEFYWILPSLVAGHLVVLALAVYRDILTNEVRDSLHWVGLGYIFAEHSVVILFALSQCL